MNEQDVINSYRRGMLIDEMRLSEDLRVKEKEFVNKVFQIALEMGLSYTEFKKAIILADDRLYREKTD